LIFTIGNLLIETGHEPVPAAWVHGEEKQSMPSSAFNILPS